MHWDWHVWGEIYYGSGWLIQAIMLFVLLRQRRRASTIAWLLLIFSIPWFGLFLYYLIGRSRLPRARIRKHAEIMLNFNRALGSFRYQGNDLPAAADSAVELAERMGHMPVVAGNQLDVIADSVAFTERLVADIAEATHHVHLLFYIFAEDDTGNQVADALLEAAARGVECRLIYDSAGSRKLIGNLPKRLQSGGVAVLEALPVGLFRRRLARIDMRNHRKLVVIDGRLAYAGSQNIVNPGYGHHDLIWHDLMVRIEGPIVGELQALFAADWYMETDQLLDSPEYFPRLPASGSGIVQTLPSGPNYPTETYHRMVVAAIYSAQRQVTITTPYLVPDQAMLQAFEIAHLRGVIVRIILPQHTDHWLVDYACRAYFDELLDAGVEIHLFRPGLLHAKTITIDDTFALFGSSNFDIRSFSLNFEVNLVFYDHPAVRMLFARQEHYRSECDLVEHARWHRRSLRRRLLQNLASLFSPLL